MNQAVRYVKTPRTRGKLDPEYAPASEAFYERHQSLMMSAFPDAWKWEEEEIAKLVPGAVRSCHSGVNELQENNLPAACGLLEKAFVEASDAGFYYFRALVNLSIAYVGSGEPALAQEILQEAREVLQSATEVPAQVQCMIWVNSAFTNFTLAQPDNDPTLLEAADLGFQQAANIDPEGVVADMLCPWAVVKALRGDAQGARNLWNDAVAQAKKDENPLPALKELKEYLNRFAILRDLTNKKEVTQ